jgi:hypothetical protein
MLRMVVARPGRGAAIQGKYFMKFAAQTLSVLAAAGLLMGAMGAAPAIAAGKKAATKPKDPNLIELIDADLKAIDKAIFGTPKKK